MVVHVHAIDRNIARLAVAEGERDKLIAEELTVELICRNVQHTRRRRGRIIDDHAPAGGARRDDEPALALNIRHAVVRRRRVNIIHMHAQCADGVRARIEHGTRAKIQRRTRHVSVHFRPREDFDRSIVAEDDVVRARFEPEVRIVSFDEELCVIFQRNVAVGVDGDRRALALDADALAALDGKAARDDRFRIRWRRGRIRTNGKLCPLALDRHVVAHLDSELACGIHGLFDRAAVEVDMLFTRNVKTAEARQRIVDRAVGDAVVRGRHIRRIVLDVDVLRGRRAACRDFSVLLPDNLAETEVDAA